MFGKSPLVGNASIFPSVILSMSFKEPSAAVGPPLLSFETSIEVESLTLSSIGTRVFRRVTGGL